MATKKKTEEAKKPKQVKVFMIANVVDGGLYSSGVTYTVPYPWYKRNATACVIVKEDKEKPTPEELGETKITEGLTKKKGGG